MRSAQPCDAGANAETWGPPAWRPRLTQGKLLLTTLDNALEVPSVLYETTAKYHVPDVSPVTVPVVAAAFGICSDCVRALALVP